jgi:ABC-type sugar transport system substrate-binding protein
VTDRVTGRRKAILRAVTAIALVSLLAGACSRAATPAPTAAPTAAATEAPSAGASEAAYQPGGTCTPTIGNGKKQFAWAIGLNELPIINSIQDEMKRYAAEKGWEVLFDPGTNANIQPMVQAVQAWITAGVPSIGITPFEKTAFQPLQQQAADKGLAMQIYAHTPLEPYNAWIAFPPSESGQQVADATVKWINANNPTAKVLISNAPKMPDSAPRWELPEKAIKEQTKATIVGMLEADDQVEGLQICEATLKAHPDLRVFVGENDDAALGCAQAFKNAGISPDETFLIGNDGSEEALKAIAAGGHMKASAALNLKHLADVVVQTGIDLACGGNLTSPGPKIIEPSVIVTKDSPELQELLDFYGSGQ